MKKCKIVALLSIVLLSINHATISAQNSVATVYIFLSPQCPICKKQTIYLKELYQNYAIRNIRFKGIFPPKMASKKDIEDFRKKFEIPFELELDKKNTLSNKFSATVTPQVFFTDSLHQVIYSGAINNWFPDVGTHRQVITENYLGDAIDNYLNGLTINTRVTKPVGCFIVK